MRKIFVFALLAISTVMMAQEKRFVIKGEMSSPMLCYSNEAVKEVKLEQIIDGVTVVTATAAVENNKFVFEGVAPKELGLCNISGFDNGTIQLFLEEGEINVGPFDAAYPAGAKIGGTPSNDMYQAYIDLNSKCVRDAKVKDRAI